MILRHRMRATLAGVAFAALGTLAAAEPISAVPCIDTWIARSDNIAEPWADHTAVFANGDVRVALLDTIEPAGSPFHLLILSPPFDLTGGRSCQVVSRGSGFGWTRLDFATLTAAYDPATGLTFAITGAELAEVSDDPITVSLTLDQQTGEITGETGVAAE